MDLNGLLALAVILLGIRLPSFMSRLGMSKKDKVAFALLMFSILGLAWFAMYLLGMFM